MGFSGQGFSKENPKAPELILLSAWLTDLAYFNFDPFDFIWYAFLRADWMRNHFLNQHYQDEIIPTFTDAHPDHIRSGH